MDKLAADHVRDIHGKELYRLSHIRRIPEFVMNAKLASEDDLADLPDGAFLDPTTRRFPAHTRADAWMSYHFIKDLNAADASNPFVKEAIDQALNLWKLAEEDSEDEMPCEMSEEDSEDEMPCEMPEPAEDADPEHVKLVVRSGDTELLAIDVYGQADLEKVASGFLANPGRFPYHVRKDFAEQVQKEASRKGWELPLRVDNDLQKTAGMAVGCKSDVVKVIQDREIVARMRRPDTLPQLKELRELVEKGAGEVVPPDLVEKVAGMVDAVDRLTGSHGRMTPPEMELFHTTVRDMREFKEAASRIRGGRYVDKATLCSEQVQEFARNELGIEFTSPEEYLNKVASGITLNQSNRLQAKILEIQMR